jgi:cell filamentation protein
MYDASPDPYCYPGTKILKNLADLRRQSDLNTFELALTTQRFAEGLPRGRLSVTHYYAVHRHLFQDIYAWAGKPRTVRIAKGGSSFCYPEHIDTEMRKLFTSLRGKRFLRGLEPQAFATGAAHFLSELNAIHAFRDGNGRTQLAFMAVLAAQAGYELNAQKIKRRSFLAAMIASFNGDEKALGAEILKLHGRI